LYDQKTDSKSKKHKPEECGRGNMMKTYTTAPITRGNERNLLLKNIIFLKKNGYEDIKDIVFLALGRRSSISGLTFLHICLSSVEAFNLFFFFIKLKMD
jgi:hypothetical protein